MKTPIYLNNKSEVIILKNNQLINKSSFQINNDRLVILGTKPVFLYVEDYDKDSLTIDFLEQTNLKLYLIVRSSKKALYNLSFKLKENAKVDVLTVFRNRDLVEVTLNRESYLDESSKLVINNAIVNMGKTIIIENVYLDAELANVEINQLNIGSYNDFSDVKQDVFHNAKYTASNIENSLISNANAKLKYSVSGRIFKGNEFSSCNQSNRGVILKDQGEIEVEPKLFIDEYNVEASHGAAIGQIDEDQLYYLLSRGLTELQARSLIISGYTKPFINSIQDEDIQNLVERQIWKKINEADVL